MQWLCKFAQVAYDFWSNISRTDRMFNEMFDNMAEETGWKDRSEKGKDAFLVWMKRKRQKDRRITIGQMYRNQSWFQWNKVIRAELLPNWSAWLRYQRA